MDFIMLCHIIASGNGDPLIPCKAMSWQMEAKWANLWGGAGGGIIYKSSPKAPLCSEA